MDVGFPVGSPEQAWRFDTWCAVSAVRVLWVVCVCGVYTRTRPATHTYTHTHTVEAVLNRPRDQGVNAYIPYPPADGLMWSLPRAGVEVRLRGLGGANPKCPYYNTYQLPITYTHTQVMPLFCTACSWDSSTFGILVESLPDVHAPTPDEDGG
jgi:hypothetical protein